MSDEKTMTASSEIERNGETVDSTPIEDNERLVPVSEAIRYRRRAQAAEQQLRALEKQVSLQQQAHEAAVARAEQSERDCVLTQELVKAGVQDVEAGLLLLEQRLLPKGDGHKEPGEAIQELCRERPWLFQMEPGGVRRELSGPTAGIRTNTTAGTSALRELAARAQESGSRQDVQAYLRLRRSRRS